MRYFRLLIITMLLSFSISSFAQENCHEVIIPKWWINIGIGSGTTFGNKNANIDIGSSAHLSINGGFTQHIFSTLYANGLVDTDDTYPERHASDMGLLVGYVDKKTKGYWSLSTGIAYYDLHIDYSNYSYLYSPKSKSGAGLPVQAQAFWTPFKHFGVGIIGHAVVIPEPYVTAMLAIQIQG